MDWEGETLNRAQEPLPERHQRAEYPARALGERAAFGYAAHVAGEHARRADALAIKRVCEHLERHAFEQVTTAELERIACMGATKLRSTFKRELGCTITEYRHRRRCERAAYLLGATDLSLARVAASVGYRSTAHLNRVFQRHYNCTMSTYRTIRRQEHPERWTSVREGRP